MKMGMLSLKSIREEETAKQMEKKYEVVYVNITNIQINATFIHIYSLVTHTYIMSQR